MIILTLLEHKSKTCFIISTIDVTLHNNFNNNFTGYFEHPQCREESEGWTIYFTFRFLCEKAIITGKIKYNEE